MSDVEAVEKPLFESQNLFEWRGIVRAICHFIPGSIESPYHQRQLLRHAPCVVPFQGLPAPFPLLRNPVMRQLLDVVHQAEELPLGIDLLLPAQREAGCYCRSRSTAMKRGLVSICL